MEQAKACSKQTDWMVKFKLRGGYETRNLLLKTDRLDFIETKEGLRVGLIVLRGVKFWLVDLGFGAFCHKPGNFLLS